MFNIENESGDYAIKIVARMKNAQGNSAQNPIFEANMLKNLSSNYVVKYIEHYERERQYEKCVCQIISIVMHYYPFTLQQVIEMKRNAFDRCRTGPMSILEFYISGELFTELLQCVQYLHEHKPFPVIHRDIKPQNVLIDFNTNTGQNLRLCDFGLATIVAGDQLTKGVGTRLYRAPEISVTHHYDWHIDIYSMGIMAQELFDIDENA